MLGRIMEERERLFAIFQVPIYHFQRFSELWEIILFQETHSGAQSTDTGPNALLKFDVRFQRLHREGHSSLQQAI